MSIVFGPIYSRRFGKSLGIDLSPSKKQCNFDCLYCELAPAVTVERYEETVSPKEVIAQVAKALQKHSDIDYLTVTANGEPTLYPYLKEVIEKLNAIKGGAKTLILSNGATVHEAHVQEALALFDEVKLSLDCVTPQCFKKLDRPHASVDLEAIKEGMRTFRARYKGRLVIEILVTKGLNDTPHEMAKLDSYLRTLKPDRIDLSTIDRPPAYGVEGVSYGALLELSRSFDPVLPVAVVARNRADVKPGSYDKKQILDTLALRPLTIEDIEALFDSPSKALFRALVEAQKIVRVESAGVVFFKTSQPLDK